MDSSSTGSVIHDVITSELFPDSTSNADGNPEVESQNPTPIEGEAPKVEGEQATEDVVADDDIEAIKAKYQQQRAIVQDPAASEAYYANKNAPQSTVAPEPQPDTQAPAMANFEELFKEEDFDIYKPQHVATVINHTVQQQLQPLMEQMQYAVGYINQLQQAEVMNQQAQMDDFVYQEVSKHLGPVSELVMKDNLTKAEQAVVSQLRTDLSQQLAEWFPPINGRENPKWFDQKVIGDALKVVSPQLRDLASQLGIKTTASKGNPAVAKVVQAENTIESSSAIPSGNAFEAAVKRNDSVGMVAALMQ